MKSKNPAKTNLSGSPSQLKGKKSRQAETNSKYSQQEKTIRFKKEDRALKDQLTEFKYHFSKLNNLEPQNTSFAIFRVKVYLDDIKAIEANFLSPSFKKVTGLESFFNYSQWLITIHPDDRQSILNAQQKALETLEFEVVARQFHPYKKEWRWFHYLSSVTPDKKGNAFFFDGIVRDVTEEKNKQYEMAKHRDRLSELVKSQNTNLIEVNSNLNKEIENRKKSEAQLKKALQEKEVLIRETHHRVKNNLQSIANLLDLESMHSPDEKALQAFQDCRDRVRAMCMVHRQLYQTESLSQIPLAPYAKDLARQLFKAYGAPPAKISIRINAPEVYLVMDVAIVCGLILNEFISNSLKYAFSEHENGILIFEARKLKNETIELFYSDNGKGLPVGLDPAKAETLGLKMVYYLVEKQLAGKLVHIKGPGCAFRLVFKNLDQEKRSASFSC